MLCSVFKRQIKRSRRRKTNKLDKQTIDKYRYEKEKNTETFFRKCN